MNGCLDLVFITLFLVFNSAINYLSFTFTEFPERPGALRKFLLGLHSGWNVSLFHYRNHGAGKSDCETLVILCLISNS